MIKENLRKMPEEIRELSTRKNWVAWRLEDNPDNPDKPRKMPYNPVTGKRAKSDDADTWLTYEEARAAIEQDITRYDGLGFMFGTRENPSGYAGIDIDHVISNDGNIKDYALEIVQTMNSYTEISPSKSGIHIIFKLKNKLSGEGYLKHGEKIECYDFGRYFTFSFDSFGYSGELGKIDGLKPIEYRDEECARVRDKYLQKPESKSETPQRSMQPTYNYYSGNDSDADILRKMFNSSEGARIQALYSGDISGYDNDHSKADYNFCKDLAYWTNKNASQTDSIFRQSGLYREKWDEVHDSEGHTYGEMTIQAALSATRDYVPDIKRPESKSSQPEKIERQSQTVQTEQQPAKSFITDAQYIDSIFESDMKNFQRYSQHFTGFSNLDNKLVLYPALYFLGAISSLGKSTFTLQLADNLAERGEHVLFFTFEQTRFELVSKSITRLAQPENDDKFYNSMPTALEIRNGRITDEVRTAIQKFKRISAHKYIIECDFTTDINFIKSTVESYIKKFAVKPVVFVDYLQLIKSDNSKLTNTKDIIDSNVRALKLLQMKNELVMFVISSLNRQNYMSVVDFESFKESGGIEYTADCVMGLQLAVMNTKLFESDSKTTKKRKVVKAAKTTTPRYIELCILKNRYGISNESFFFEYYSQFDKFIPTTREKVNEVISRLVKDNSDDEDRRPI